MKDKEYIIVTILTILMYYMVDRIMMEIIKNL
jgi:hypothetical protein